MRLGAQRHSVLVRLVRHLRKQCHLLFEILLHIALAARSDIDHRDTDLGARLKSQHQPLLVERAMFHRQQVQFVFFRQLLDLIGLRLPVVEFEMLAHALDRR